jgi:pSer/pThr/pTyr-binding forkhead associated (FHA) protein
MVVSVTSSTSGCVPLPSTLKIKRPFIAPHLLNPAGAIATLQVGEKIAYLHTSQRFITIGQKGAKRADIQIDDPAIAREHIVLCYAPDKISVHKFALPLDESRVSLRHADGTIDRVVSTGEIDLTPLRDGDQILLGSSKIARDGNQASFQLVFRTVKDPADQAATNSPSPAAKSAIPLCALEGLPLQIVAREQAVNDDLQLKLSQGGFIARARALKQLLANNSLESYHIIMSNMRLRNDFLSEPSFLNRLGYHLERVAGADTSQRELARNILETLEVKHIGELLLNGTLDNCTSILSLQILVNWLNGFMPGVNYPRDDWGECTIRGRISDLAAKQLSKRASHGDWEALATMTGTFAQDLDKLEDEQINTRYYFLPAVRILRCFVEMANKGDNRIEKFVKEFVHSARKNKGRNYQFLRSYPDRHLPQLLDLFNFAELLDYCRNYHDYKDKYGVVSLDIFMLQKMLKIAECGTVAAEKQQAIKYFQEALSSNEKEKHEKALLDLGLTFRVRALIEAADASQPARDWSI